MLFHALIVAFCGHKSNRPAPDGQAFKIAVAIFAARPCLAARQVPGNAPARTKAQNLPQGRSLCLWCAL